LEIGKIITLVLCSHCKFVPERLSLAGELRIHPERWHNTTVVLVTFNGLAP
jgi:hypothetical protein